ncbi:3-deoxy-7-phosphoheptulonate synthase [Actinocatenispora comari]|uniref:3-deoxy-7-phosphoheptulonate synthase n=1 Tax=Actinocatenispora comari TaxID=2807577 RepID=A0A8J4AE96_9ACTN|nr:3-deoxy-7-phosphoheptulonate synthase [Actinocatenispora comari]GIL29070.1 phospho-2-dehydro-3-deoxyheptonate aldolase [Actinocatenispora comari]
MTTIGDQNVLPGVAGDAQQKPTVTIHANVAAGTTGQWLPTPGQLRAGIPLGIRTATLVTDTRQAIIDILTGTDSRLLVVCGPCSLHDPNAALDYAQRLRIIADQLSDDLLIVMRTYVEKPRTALGWRGMVADPGLIGTGDLRNGLVLARATLRGVLREGMPTATEFVDPAVAAYLQDTVCWGAIGARTVESPTHRQLAASLRLPIGFKNRLDGAVVPAINAALTAATEDHILALAASGSPTRQAAPGNPCPHLVLRGGESGPNYAPSIAADAADQLRANGLPMLPVVDAAHGNSRKNPAQQQVVLGELADLIEDPAYPVAGVMIESNLVGGRQDVDLNRPHALTYGQSITDACIVLDDTRPLLTRLARACHARRRQRQAQTRSLRSQTNRHEDLAAVAELRQVPVVAGVGAAAVRSSCAR